jgi:hypothetical protein
MWARLATVLAGVWLMAAPFILGYAGPAATSDLVVGPSIAAVAIVAMSQATRPVRWLNLPIAFWLLAAPWILGYGPASLLNSTCSGLAVAALTSIRGRVNQRFGGGWRSLVRSGGE